MGLQTRRQTHKPSTVKVKFIVVGKHEQNEKVGYYVGVVGGVARGAGVGRGGMWRGTRRQDGVGKRSYEGYSGVGRGGGGLRGQGGAGIGGGGQGGVRRGGDGPSESVQHSNRAVL